MSGFYEINVGKGFQYSIDVYERYYLCLQMWVLIAAEYAA